MRMLWLWILAGVVAWPVHSTVATVGGKPIDLMLSDLLFLVMPIAYLFVRSTPTAQECELARAPISWYPLTPALALICIIYMTALAGIGLGISGETVRVFSAFKLAKPIGFVLLGVLLGSWTNPLEFVDVFGKVFATIAGLTIFFTLTDPSFPLGEWGKYIFEFELSGYPNSPMSFYAVLVPLVMAVADSSRNPTLRLICWGISAGTALIILGSMSRSSTLALFFGVTIYLAMTGRRAFLAVSFVLILLMSIVGFGLFSALRDTQVVTVLMQRVQDRVDRSTESEDPSSGRFEIWEFAIELWAEKPVFGYLFESFSRYAGDVDTPHQQYLEVLYKCGGLGLLIYGTLLASCMMVTRRLLRLTDIGSPAWYRLHAMAAMLCGVLLGNLTQPNLTYSLTGNMIFLMFGCLCSARAVVSASQPLYRPATREITRPHVDIHRSAA
ncbi:MULTISPECIES: O-antigen ligase family protein [unclassified Schlesneria]|uniref:O-antigen ligase family protein n=1 Tax=unclassified Schlesneria TaxID=2762017 RepID=UPI002EED1B62